AVVDAKSVVDEHPAVVIALEPEKLSGARIVLELTDDLVGEVEIMLVGTVAQQLIVNRMEIVCLVAVALAKVRIVDPVQRQHPQSRNVEARHVAEPLSE